MKRIQWLIIAAATNAILSTFSSAQTNNYIATTDGFWDEARLWSLAAPPSISQSGIFITNSADVNVTIDNITASEFPDTLTISNLAIYSADVAGSALYLNNTGTTALHVLGGLIISAPPGLNAGGAAALFSTNSMLVVDGLLGGELLDNGTIVVVNGSLVTTNCTLGIGSHERAISPAYGLLTVSNSTVEARDVSIGGETETYGTLEVIGGTMTLSASLMIGTGNSSDGNVLVANGGLLVVTNANTELGGDGTRGTLVVSNASFFGADIAVAVDEFSSGTVMINNGTVNVDYLGVGAAGLASGNVSLNGGALTVVGMQIPGYQSNGNLSIADGTFTCQSVTIGFAMFSNGSLGIGGGTAIISSNLDIGGDTDSAHLSISGGQLILTNATMLVDGGPTNSGIQAGCIISGGEVAAQSIVLGQFLTGNLSMTGGSLTVSDGITMGDCPGQAYGFLIQSGGQLIASNPSHNAFIDVQNGQLSLFGGILQVDTLVMTNTCSSLVHTGGTLLVGSVILDPNAFRIVSATRQSNDVLISWLMAPGATNALQASTGTINGSYTTNTFTDIFIVTNNTTTGTLTNFLDLGAATNKSRYYRARLSL